MPDPKQIHNHLLTAFKLAQGTNVQDRLFDAWSKTKNLRENGDYFPALALFASRKALSSVSMRVFILSKPCGE